MKKYILITADYAEHAVVADNAEAACTRFECCNHYPYQAVTLITPDGNRIDLRYGHMPTDRQLGGYHRCDTYVIQ